jgi:hypothetical protein
MKQGGLFNFAKNIPGNLTPGKEVPGTFNGRDYFQLYNPGGKNVPSSYTIKIACPSSGIFSISRESGFDRFFKSLGVTREIQTGDKDFDQEFFINTNAIEFTSAFFMNPEKCLTVKSILELGFTKVEHDGKTMAAICSPVKFEEPLDQTVIQKIVSFLTQLSENINDHPGEGIYQASKNWKIKRIVAFSIPILLCIVGVPTFFLGFFEYTPLDKWELFLKTLKFSVPSFLFFLIMALKLIKGRSSSHRELIVVLVLALVAFPGAGMGLGTFLNGWLDQSGATSYVVPVLEKYTTSTKNGKNYHLVLKSWRSSRYSESLRVSSSEYMRVKPNRTEMKVVTKPGYYWFEWIVDAEVT